MKYSDYLTSVVRVGVPSYQADRYGGWTYTFKAINRYSARVIIDSETLENTFGVNRRRATSGRCYFHPNTKIRAGQNIMLKKPETGEDIEAVIIGVTPSTAPDFSAGLVRANWESIDNVE